jgi:hypothetical protein
MRLLFSNILVATALFGSSCTQSTEKVTPAPMPTTPVNTVCPIMGGKVTPSGGSTTWNGQMIGFCCDSCIPDWNELSDEQKAEKLAKAAQGRPDEMKKHDHGGHQHSG